MLSLKQLRVFASIARHENLGAAADELYLSKGAVSQALAELERRLGSPLFDRVHPRLKLNAQGKQLQPLAEDVMDRVEDILHLFDHGGELRGTLRIGASQTIGNYLLPPLLAKMSGQVQLQIFNTYELCEMLSRFDLDLALIEGQSHHPELVTEPWRHDEMLIVAAADSELVGQSSLDLADLRSYDWVMREQYSGTRVQFDQEIAPFVSPLGRVQEFNTLEAVMLAVEHGLGLTLVSRHAVQDRLDRGCLAHVDIKQKFSRELTLVWHKQKFHSAILRNFIALVQQGHL